MAKIYIVRKYDSDNDRWDNCAVFTDENRAEEYAAYIDDGIDTYDVQDIDLNPEYY